MRDLSLMKMKSSLPRVAFPVASLGLSAIAIYGAIACGSSNPESVFDGGGADDAGGSSSTSSGFVPNEGGDGSGGDLDAGPIGVLEAVVRDFKYFDTNDPNTNPDFENVPSFADRPDGAPDSGDYVGPWTEATPAYFTPTNYPIDIVQPLLGSDGAPQYNTAASFKGQAGRTATTHGKTFFDQWYHDTPGKNVTRKVQIQLTRDPVTGIYTYDSAVSGLPESPVVAAKGFWPIDDDSPNTTAPDGFGNQAQFHNYHFTVELRTRFTYKGTETFKFSGDDDVFVFINKKLVINIGGIHEALTKEVNLAQMATDLGLVVGQEYPLDFFQAERHIVQSNLRIDTTLDLRPNPGPK